MTQEDVYRLAYYIPQIEDMIRIVEAYPTTMEELNKIARMAAIIDAERGPGHTSQLLAGYYKYYHGEH